MSSLRLPVSSLLIASMLAMTLIAGAGDALAAPAAPRNILKGEDFYRGIFLAQGPLADRIPEIRDHMKIDMSKVDPRVMRLIHDFNDRLIDSLAASDPTFMSRFGAAMQSGDHFRIDEMITEGTKATLAAIHEMPEIVALRAKIEKDPTYVDTLIESIRAEGNGEVSEEALRQAINVAIAGRNIGDPVANTTVVVAIAAVAAVVAATYVLVVHSVGGVFTVALAAAIVKEFAAWTGVLEPLSKGNLLREQLIDNIAQKRFRE